MSLLWRSKVAGGSATEFFAVSQGEWTCKVFSGLDSGAKVTVRPPELLPEVPTMENKDSRAGVKYFGPGDKK
eukprot:2272053-Karenia_brevis.AAC.1